MAEFKENDLLRYLRVRGNGIPVVFFVLWQEEEYERNAVRFGNVFFIQKTRGNSSFENLCRKLVLGVGRNLGAITRIPSDSRS